MSIHPSHALEIHNALHSERNSVTVDSTNLNIMTNPKGIRLVTYNECIFEQHDPSKPSRWTQKAKNGAKLTWIKPEGKPIKHGLIMDGEFVILTPVLSSDSSEPPKKKQKTDAPKQELARTSSLSELAQNKTPEVLPTIINTSSSPKIIPSSGSQLVSSGSSSSLMEQWQLKYEELQMGEEIGAGAFGSVLKGTFRGTDVAIKILHSQDKSAQEMFSKEADLMFRLRHPNIVQFMGAVITPPCIVMELMSSNLSALIKKGQISDKKFDRIILGIAKGLNFLHMANPQVIHRDLKPGNILLDHASSPKIADFGVSREKAAEAATMTRIGTPTYCAPEVLNNEYYSTKVDIYSFGMLIYAMAAGGSPWKDENLGPLQVMMRIAVKKERPVVPSNCRSQISSLIISCWQHDPDLRPDAGSLIKQIEAILAAQNSDGNQNGGAASKPQISTTPTLLLAATAPVCVPTQPIHMTTAATRLNTAPLALPADPPKSNSNSGLNVPVCQYDATCYRFKQDHKKEFSHPQRDSYRSYVNSFLTSGSISEQQKKDLNEYRISKQISLDIHYSIVKDLDWTLQEWENGKKESKKRKRKEDTA